MGKWFGCGGGEGILLEERGRGEGFCYAGFSIGKRGFTVWRKIFAM